MKQDELTVTINGQIWQVQFVTRRHMKRKHYGDCDWDHKVIRVRKDVSPLNVLDTLIHEVRHAQHPVLYEAEEFITTTSTELAKVIAASGIVDIKVGRKQTKRNKRNRRDKK